MKNEVEVLADIRKAIMAEKGLSIDAQNVKIVYSKTGLVILRGPVNSLEEKTRVGDLVPAAPPQFMPAILQS